MEVMVRFRLIWTRNGRAYGMVFVVLGLAITDDS